MATLARDDVHAGGPPPGLVAVVRFIDTLSGWSGWLFCWLILPLMLGTTYEVIVRRDRTELLNVTLPMSVHSLRLAQDGSAVLVGGFADPVGRIAYLDHAGEPTIRWQQETPVRVGLVDLDALGLVAMAVEEEPPSSTIHVYDASTGATRWTRRASGFRSGPRTWSPSCAR